MRKIVISDIHGCNKTFQKLLASVKPDKSDQLLLLGDPSLRQTPGYEGTLREMRG